MLVLPPSPLTLPQSKLIGRVIDNTSIKDYKTCARKYLYGQVFHRRKRGLTAPLAYGSQWHYMMEANYKAPIMSREDLIDHARMAAAERYESSGLDDYRTFDRGVLEFERYLKRYGLPWEEEAKTVGWPDMPLVELPVELPIPGARHPYAGKIDRIISVSGQYLIEDHKTASQLRGDYFRQFELDDQMLGYTALARILTGLPVAGVRINAHIVHKNDSIFERQTIHFAEPRIQDWMQNLDIWMGRLEDSMAQLQASAGMTPAAQKVAVEAAFPANYSACAGKYGMCQYAGVCVLAPVARQAVLEAEFDEVPWNPLAVAEESIDG